jgi:sulfane dehydrogenase subunit SoxC
MSNKRNSRDIVAAGPTLPAPAPADVRRRRFLAHSASVAGTLATAGAAVNAAAQEVPPWMKVPGAPMRNYGTPSKFETAVQRPFASGYASVSPATGSSRTPHQSLEGTITPNGLHFERHHNGVPDIDPAKHELLIHGLVNRPLVFNLATLSRYPMISRTHFIECAGNSGPNAAAVPPPLNAGGIHGLASTSEWTGIPLALLLNEAGVNTEAKWILAEGADSAAMTRSVPLSKCMDDAMVALYQNGERVRPEQGYPMRLLLPGWEGNMNVKWLRRIKVTDGPTHTKDETSKYSDLQPNGRARQFTFELGVKSVITFPSGGQKLERRGWYEITGLAWSGAGRIARVDISADGGTNWREATLQGPILSKSFTRFRLPWDWNGVPALLQSRATDEKGYVQPTRQAFVSQYVAGMNYHNHYIQTWAIAADGSINNAFV